MSEDKKKYFLIVNGCYPTVHGSQTEMYDYFHQNKLRENAMFCIATDKDFREAFCNCIFKSI